VQEIRGLLYDDSGVVIERWLMPPGGIEPGFFPAVHVPQGQYHTCQSLESGTVIIEFKNGKYNPKATEDILPGTTEPMNHCAMETVKKMLKGIWDFCRYVFVPQRRAKGYKNK